MSDDAIPKFSANTGAGGGAGISRVSLSGGLGGGAAEGGRHRAGGGGGDRRARGPAALERGAGLTFLPTPSAIGAAFVKEFWLIPCRTGGHTVVVAGGGLRHRQRGRPPAGRRHHPVSLRRERLVTPYILVLVTTPMLALVPLLILRSSAFGYEPRIIAVALASASDGDDHIPLGASRFSPHRTAPHRSRWSRSYGDTYTLREARAGRCAAQDPWPLRIVSSSGWMIGAIFGMLTAWAPRSVAAASASHNRLTTYSSYMINMPEFLRRSFLIPVGHGRIAIMYGHVLLLYRHGQAGRREPPSPSKS